VTAAVLLCVFLAFPLTAPAPAPVIETQHYDPDTLFEYINGAAEAYLALDFQELTVLEWKSGTRTLRTAEVYRMRDAARAWGIYARERPGAGALLPVGAEGYAEEGTLNFLLGPHYVKMAGARPGDDEAKALLAWAKELASDLGGDPSLPDPLACFPSKGRVPRSERFTARQFLGLSFLEEAWSAEYRSEGKEFKAALMKSRRTSRDAALIAWARSAGTVLPEEGDGPRFFLDPRLGEVAAQVRGDRLAAVIGAADPKAASRLLAVLLACGEE
jgi:hypothetical protein